MFVLPSVDIGLPSGGALTIYNLANRLKSDGYSVFFVFLNNCKSYFHKKDPMISYHYSVFDILQLFPRLTTQIISPLYRIIRGIRKFENEPLSNERIFVRMGEKLRMDIHIDNLIACEWISSYFANDFDDKKVSNKFRIINHSEEDKRFNPLFSEYALASYQFPITKIVYNHSLEKKFGKENVLRFTYGYDDKRFQLKIDMQSKPNDCLLVPLRNGKEKGTEFALEVIDKIHQSHPKIKIVAFGNYRGKVPEGVEFHFSPTTELNELYNKSSVFFLPSTVEGFSLPTVEAMACGCAIVCIKNEGTMEYINEGINGIFAKPGDSKGVAEIIIDLLSDEGKRSRLAREGVSTARNFTQDNMYVSFRKLFT